MLKSRIPYKFSTPRSGQILAIVRSVTKVCQLLCVDRTRGSSSKAADTLSSQSVTNNKTQFL